MTLRREILAGSTAWALSATMALPQVGDPTQRLTIVQGRRLGGGFKVAVRDLDRYLTRAGVRTDRRSVAGSGHLPPGSLIIFLDAGDPDLVALHAAHRLSPLVGAAGSFAISTRERREAPGHRIYFLEGADALGEQYACYAFLERFAGIRFLHPDFEHVPKYQGDAGPIDTRPVEPAFAHRGLYPWNYNYDSRGLNTFCDINARFVARDWAWFARLGDWLIKNKQDTLFWFDDVFDDAPLSARFPASLRTYWRDRGLRQVLGLGWGSNEGRPRGGRWEGLTCVDARGDSIEDAEWRKAVCPEVPEYRALADANVARVDVSAPEAIGALIGYGENTWAAHQTSKCVRHATVRAETLMLRDLERVRVQMTDRGAGNLPLGFVVSTHSAQDDSPFSSGGVIEALPRNGFVSLHVYQQDVWTNFADIFAKIRARNEREAAEVKALPIAEVAFLCNYDIPLFRPSILRRREAHIRSVPRQDALGHLTTLNTTQYLYWLNAYALMRWQWDISGASWGDEISALGVDLFGGTNGALFVDLVARFASLDLMTPASERTALLASSDDLTRIPAWTRYSPQHHADDFGFFLWARGQGSEALLDAGRNATECLRLNDVLRSSAGSLYRAQFYDTFALTAHYHALRIHLGKADLALTSELCGDDRCAREVRSAIADLEQAKAALAAYDRHLARVVDVSTPTAVASLKQDFVLNPSVAFIDSHISRLSKSLSDSAAPLPIFAARVA